jgi:hypothetical protein
MGRLFCVLALLLITAACKPERYDLPDGETSGARVSVRAVKSTYRPGETLVVKVRNQNTREVFLDMCSGSVQGGSHRCGVFRLCAPFATPEDVLQHMRRIPAGESMRDTFHVNSCAAPGQWWVELSFLDRDGHLLPGGIQRSEPFRVIR